MREACKANYGVHSQGSDHDNIGQSQAREVRGSVKRFQPLARREKVSEVWRMTFHLVCSRRLRWWRGRSFGIASTSKAEMSWTAFHLHSQRRLVALVEAALTDG